MVPLTWTCPWALLHHGACAIIAACWSGNTDASHPMGFSEAQFGFSPVQFAEIAMPSLPPAGRTRTGHSHSNFVDFLNAQLGSKPVQLVDIVPSHDHDVESLSSISSWECYGRCTVQFWLNLVYPITFIWLFGQFAWTPFVSMASKQAPEGTQFQQTTARTSWSTCATCARTGAHSLATALVATKESFLPWLQSMQSPSILFPGLKLMRQLLLLSTIVKLCSWPSWFFSPQRHVDALEVVGDWGPCHFGFWLARQIRFGCGMLHIVCQVQHVRRAGQFCRCLRKLGMPLLVSSLDLARTMTAVSIHVHTVGQKLLAHSLPAGLDEVRAVNLIHAARRLHCTLMLALRQLTVVVRQPNKGCLPLF